MFKLSEGRPTRREQFVLCARTKTFRATRTRMLALAATDFSARRRQSRFQKANSESITMPEGLYAATVRRIYSIANRSTAFCNFERIEDGGDRWVYCKRNCSRFSQGHSNSDTDRDCSGNGRLDSDIAKLYVQQIVHSY